MSVMVTEIPESITALDMKAIYTMLSRKLYIRSDRETWKDW